MNINSKLKIFLSAGFVLAVIVFAFWLSRIVSGNEDVANIIAHYGYFGLFIAAIIGGFNLIIPIPAVTFIPAVVESGLNYWLAILILGVGTTLADSIAYYLGRAGRGFFSGSLEGKVTAKLESWREKSKWYPVLAVFVAAAIFPLPNEIFLMPLGFMRYNYAYLLPAVFAGNLVFNFLFSQGFISLFNIL